MRFFCFLRHASAALLALALSLVLVASTLPPAPARAGYDELPPFVANGGRLVPITGTSCAGASPVLAADASGAITICWVPFNSRFLIAGAGQVFNSGRTTLALSPGNEPAGANYDVWAIVSAGAPVLCAEGSYWSSTTARSTAVTIPAAATGGISNTAALSHCYNGSTDYGTIAANSANYLGSFYVPTAAATTVSSQTSGATTLALAAALTGPGLYEQFYVAVDTGGSLEYELATAGFGTATLTVTRGQLGTSAVAHTSAAVAVAGGQTAVQMAPAYISSGGNNPLVGLFNAYNRIPLAVFEGDGSSSYTYGTSTWRQAHGLSSNQITILDGLAATPITAAFLDNVQPGSSNSDFAYIGVERNWTSGNPGGLIATSAGYSGGESTTVTAANSWQPLLGLSNILALEISNAGTTTFYAARGSGQNWLLAAQLQQ